MLLQGTHNSIVKLRAGYGVHRILVIIFFLRTIVLTLHEYLSRINVFFYMIAHNQLIVIISNDIHIRLILYFVFTGAIPHRPFETKCSVFVAVKLFVHVSVHLNVQLLF